VQKLLATMGASKVSAYVTHGVFPKRSWERFVHDNGGIDSTQALIFFLGDCTGSRCWTSQEISLVEPST